MSYLVANLEDRFSRDEAQLILCLWHCHTVMFHAVGMGNSVPDAVGMDKSVADAAFDLGLHCFMTYELFWKFEKV